MLRVQERRALSVRKGTPFDFILYTALALVSSLQDLRGFASLTSQGVLDSQCSKLNGLYISGDTAVTPVSSAISLHPKRIVQENSQANICSYILGTS